MNAAVALDLNSWPREMSAAIARRFPNRRDALPGSAPNVTDYPNIHNSTLSVVTPRSYAERDGMPSPTDPKTVRKSRNDIRTELIEALTRAIPPREVPAKEVARRINSSPDTVDHHRQGNVPQSWAQMIEYCRAYPAFGLEVMELMGIDIDGDRNAYAMFLQFQKQVRER